jgi:hypothetical protein
LPCPALCPVLVALQGNRTGQKNNFCPAGQDRAGQGGRATGQPCPDDGLCAGLSSIDLDLFADGNDFSWETIQKGRNSYYQNQLASQITSQVNGILSLITSVLKIQINVGQSTVMNTPNVYMSLETRTFQSLSNKVINQVGNSRIQLPSNFNSNMSDNSPVSIRVRLSFLCYFFKELLFIVKNGTTGFIWQF